MILTKASWVTRTIAPPAGDKKKVKKPIHHGISRGVYQTYSVNELDSAIQDVQNDKSSIRAAAAEWNVPATTLTDHLRAHMNGTTVGTRGRPTSMSKEAEEALAEWVVWCSYSCKPKAVDAIRRKAQALRLAMDGSTFMNQFDVPTIPSHSWWKSYAKRNDLLVVSAKYRGEAAPTRAEFERFFNDYERRWTLHKYPPDRIWNMDETGRARHDKAGRVVVGSTLQRNAQYGDDDNDNDEKVTAPKRKRRATAPLKRKPFNDHVTMVCCINAMGESLPVSWIIPGKTTRSLENIHDIGGDGSSLLYTTGNTHTIHTYKARACIY